MQWIIGAQWITGRIDPYQPKTLVILTTPTSGLNSFCSVLRKEGADVAAQVLAATGVTTEVVRTEVEPVTGRGCGNPLTIPPTPRAKRVLELSLEQERQYGHRYIGTEHLLLGILRAGQGVAANALENLGLNLQVLGQQVRPAAMHP